MKSFLRDTVLCRRDFFNFLNYNIVKGGLDMVNKYKTVKQLSDEGYNPLKGNKYETQDLLSLGGFLFAKLFDTRSVIFSKLLSGFGSFDQGFRWLQRDPRWFITSLD